MAISAHGAVSRAERIRAARDTRRRPGDVASPAMSTRREALGALLLPMLPGACAPHAIRGAAPRSPAPPPGTSPADVARDETYWAEVARAFTVDRTAINLLPDRRRDSARRVPRPAGVAEPLHDARGARSVLHCRRASHPQRDLVASVTDRRLVRAARAAHDCRSCRRVTGSAAAHTSWRETSWIAPQARTTAAERRYPGRSRAPCVWAAGGPR